MWKVSLNNLILVGQCMIGGMIVQSLGTAIALHKGEELNVGTEICVSVLYAAALGLLFLIKWLRKPKVAKSK